MIQHLLLELPLYSLSSPSLSKVIDADTLKFDYN